MDMGIGRTSTRLFCLAQQACHRIHRWLLLVMIQTVWQALLMMDLFTDNLMMD